MDELKLQSKSSSGLRARKSAAWVRRLNSRCWRTSFGARSETKPVWRISLFTNINLAIVVAISFGLQVWSHHNAILGRFLKTSSMSLTDCFLLLAVGAIPLLVLELVKVVRNSRKQRKSEP